jgi:hypothetical protein
VFAVSALALGAFVNASGQSTSAANALSTKSGDEDTTQLSVPGGAGATVTSTGTAGAGPLIGFQVGKQDDSFISSFFTFSPPQTLTGQQHDFGAFLLNPPGQGTSFTFVGNKVFGVYRDKDSKLVIKKSKGVKTDDVTKPATVADAAFFWGFGVRAGISSTVWQTGAGSTQQSESGTVLYLVPEFVVTSKTYKLQDAAGVDTNQYQFGASVGPSFRGIGGDLAQVKNDAFRASLLGTDEKAHWGTEVTFFVRMNQFKPYVRFTHFSQPPTSFPQAAKGIDVAGFSGSQFVFGVDVLSAIFQTKLK